MTEPQSSTDESLSGNYDVRRQITDTSLVPPETTSVEIRECDADDYLTVHYLDNEGNVLLARDVAQYRVESSLRDGKYTIAVEPAIDRPGGVRTTQAIETVACLKNAVSNLSTRQLRLAYHSAKATVSP